MGTGVMKKKCRVSWEEEVVAGWGLPILGLGSHRVSPPGNGHMKVRGIPRQVGRPSRQKEKQRPSSCHPQARQVLGETTWSEVGRRVGLWEAGEPRTGKPKGREGRSVSCCFESVSSEVDPRECSLCGM